MIRHLRNGAVKSAKKRARNSPTSVPDLDGHLGANNGANGPTRSPNTPRDDHIQMVDLNAKETPRTPSPEKESLARGTEVVGARTPSPNASASAKKGTSWFRW